MKTIALTSIDFWVDTGVTIAGIFFGIVFSAVYTLKKYKEKLKKENSDNKTENFLFFESNCKHSTVHEMLTSLRFQLNADRVQVGQFHNGGKFLEGSAMKKFSITYESCGPGISMEYLNLQNTMLSLFWSIIDMIKENDGKIRLTRSLAQESYLKAYNDSKNIQAFSILPIRKQELYIGFIKAEWSNLHDVPDDYDDSERLMDKYRSFIELELIRGD